MGTFEMTRKGSETRGLKFKTESHKDSEVWFNGTTLYTTVNGTTSVGITDSSLAVAGGLSTTAQAAVGTNLTVGGSATVTGALSAASVSGTVAATSLGNDANCGQLLCTETTLTADEIVGTAAGDIGHVDGAILVAAPTSDYVLEFVSAVLIYDYDTAAYTGGGDDNVIQIGGGGSQTTLTAAIAGADLLEAAGDKIVYVSPLSTGDIALPVGSAISLAGTALTQPGTAAGVLRVHTTYRVHTTGL